jgi:hypothetical protein
MSARRQSYLGIDGAFAGKIDTSVTFLLVIQGFTTGSTAAMLT